MSKSFDISARKPSKHSWLWQEGEALSDTLLRVLHCPSAKGGASAEELAAIQARSVNQEEYRLHSVVLAANSIYFKNRLLTACHTAISCSDLARGNALIAPRAVNASAATLDHPDEQDSSVQSANSQTSGKLENGAATPMKMMHLVEERLAPADTAAARSVLRHMYTEELVYDSPSHLVSILKIADKWQAADTVDACRQAFSQLQPEDLTLEVIKQVYSLEGIIHNAANFAELVEMVKERLATYKGVPVSGIQLLLECPCPPQVHMFCDVVDVIINPTTRAQFLQLPFAAVVALLRSPQLLVDSENSVVVAANLWIVQGKGRTTTAEQRRYLAASIHLPGLSPSYLCGMLPNLKWFSFPGQPFVSWPQALPGPYYGELQQRLVAPAARPLIQTTSALREPNARPSEPALSSSLSQRSTSSAASSLNHQTSSKSLGGGPVSDPVGKRRSSGDANGANTDSTPFPRVLREQNLEIECEIEFSRLRQYIADGYAGLMAGPNGFHGVHVMSECTFFKGFLWGVKLVFGYSSGRVDADQPPPFTVTPSPFACLPPGEEGIRPLTAPITCTFKCSLEAVGPQGSPFGSATYQGASYLRPGEEHVSSIGIANFFKRVQQQHLPECWQPYLVNDKLKLKLRVLGASVE